MTLTKCFNCGKELPDDTDDCECGFSFNEIFQCPFKNESKCRHLNLDCNITGLNFESCQTFLATLGILD